MEMGIDTKQAVPMPQKFKRLEIWSRETGLLAIVGAAAIGWLNAKTASMWALELYDTDADKSFGVMRCVSREQAIVKGMEFVFAMSEAEMRGQPMSVEAKTK